MQQQPPPEREKIYRFVKADDRTPKQSDIIMRLHGTEIRKGGWVSGSFCGYDAAHGWYPLSVRTSDIEWLEEIEAPAASPVMEEKPDDFLEWLNAEIHSQLPYVYDDDAHAMSIDAKRIAARNIGVAVYQKLRKPSPSAVVDEKSIGHKDIPNVDMIKIMAASEKWNDEIAPHFLKGMVRGYLLAIGKLQRCYYEPIPDDPAHPIEPKMKCETCIHQQVHHEETGTDASCGKGHWEGLGNPNAPVAPGFNYWQDCPDFSSIEPGEQKSPAGEIPAWFKKWGKEWLHKMECQGVDPRQREGFKKELEWAYWKINEGLDQVVESAVAFSRLSVQQANQLASARAIILDIKRGNIYQEPADECDKWLTNNPEIK